MSIIRVGTLVEDKRYIFDENNFVIGTYGIGMIIEVNKTKGIIKILYPKHNRSFRLFIENDYNNFIKTGYIKVIK